jgi:predicted nucleic acid-binding protein
LAGHRRIAIDANVFIYLIEASERYGELAQAVFEWVKQPGHSAVASTLVLTELLVPLYRERGSPTANGHDKVSRARTILATYPNLEWIAADFGIADLAAQYRAQYLLKTPDALHAATAVHAGATGFVTNDGGFNRVEEFETLQFDTLH